MAKGTGTSRSRALKVAPTKALKALDKVSYEATKAMEDQLDTLEKELEKKGKPEKKPFRKGVTWLSECIAIWDMYRVKGHPGIWVTNSKHNRGNMISMQQFLTTNFCTVRTDKLEALSTLVIKRLVDDGMPLIEALDNLQEYRDNKPFTDEPDYNSESFLNVICSGYDPDEFKHYHAKKIVSWYNELVTGLNDKDDE